MCSASVAAKKGDSSELSIVLEFDPRSANESSTCKRTPLHLASQVRDFLSLSLCVFRFIYQGGFNECVELLIEATADVNVPN